MSIRKTKLFIFIIGLLLLAPALAVSVKPGKVLAAPPGCYALDHEHFGQALTCPANLQAGVQSGNCYGGAKNGPGPNDYRFFELNDCDIESLRSGEQEFQPGCYYREDEHILRVLTCPSSLSSQVQQGGCFLASSREATAASSFARVSCNNLELESFAFTGDCNEPGEQTRENCKIIDYLVIGINVLSVVAGLAIVFSFIWTGYLYITARDNPQFVAQAKDRVFWTLIALAVYLFMYAILNWLVPGGVLPS